MFRGFWVVPEPKAGVCELSIDLVCSASFLQWDNRACMHRALQDFGPHERSMRRVTIQGDVPFYSAHGATVLAVAQETSKL